MRAVVDPNVLISALLSPRGNPAQVLARWLAGDFELIVSAALLDELGRALAYDKLRARISEDEATELVSLLRRTARVAEDPAHPRPRSPDPGDDYLLALAESERAVLVSGDPHLLGLSNRFPVLDPAAFLETLTSH